MEHVEKALSVTQTDATAESTNRKTFTVSDFSITELEDRLEMTNRCNGRCDGK